MSFATTKTYILIVLSLRLAFGTDDYLVYIITVNNLHQTAEDQRTCDATNFNAVHIILLESHRFAIDYVNANVLNGTGLKLRTFVIDSCYNADLGLQQIDCIFSRMNTFGLMSEAIQNGMCTNRELEINEKNSARWNLPAGMLVAVTGPMSSNTASQYAKLMEKYCIPVLGSAATSKRFDNMNNNDRFKFFLRSVPCDMCQVNATLHLLERMNWRQIAIVHETSVYAQDFYNEFSKLVDKLPTDKKICIVGDQEVEYNDPNNWNDTLNKLEESGARVILLFMDFPQAKQFFDAAACRSTWLNGNYQFVGIDAWSNQLDFSHNSKSLIVNSITSEPSSPILEEFRKYIIGLTLEEVRRREKPDFCPEIDKYTPIADTIMAHNHCDNSSCTGNETLGEVAEGTLIKASFEFDNVYVIAKALANFCNGSSSCKDKLAELNGTHFYDMMKTIEITDLPDYYFKFWNNSNSGIPSYNFYQYQKTNHSEYAWKLVGNYSDSVEDEYKVFIFDGSIVNKIGSIECPKISTIPSLTIEISVGAVMIVVVFALIAFIVYKQHQNGKQRVQMQTQSEKLRKALEAQISRPSIINKQQQLYSAGFDIIPRDALKITDLLGEGQFGKVWKASFGENEIAVKVLHEQSTDEMSKFVKELLTMIQLGYHPNILRVLGAVTENMHSGNLMICIEYCVLGSLKQLIQRERDRYIDERTDIDKYHAQTIDPAVWYQLLQDKTKIGYNLATRDLLSYGFQIANGMCYLEERGVVHRDLASRNVLVNHNKIVKISDYGLAEVYPYVMKNPEKIPIRILAPECLGTKHIFTTSSDVWAFAVLLWDIFNLCLEEPYEILNARNADDILQLLTAGQRLEIPQFATKTLYDFMLGCWNFEREMRPSFVNCENFMASELQRCAAGSFTSLKKKLRDEIANVMKDERNKLCALTKQRKDSESTLQDQPSTVSDNTIPEEPNDEYAKAFKSEHDNTQINPQVHSPCYRDFTLLMDPE